MIHYFRLEMGLGKVGEGDQQMCLSLILNPKTSTSKKWFLYFVQVLIEHYVQVILKTALYEN